MHFCPFFDTWVIADIKKLKFLDNSFRIDSNEVLNNFNERMVPKITLSNEIYRGLIRNMLINN